jgi:phage/plasmid primase-like uncharacterized protein
MHLSQIVPHLDMARKTGAGYIACCIAHKDRTPSMTIRESDGMLLIHCHAGCSQDDLIDAMKSRGWWPESRSPELRSSKPDIDYRPTEVASQRAVSLSTPAPDNHPYLIRKDVQPCGVGQLGQLYRGLPNRVRNRGNVLVIPMQDIRGEILSCQFIAGDGSKAYISGSKRKGGFFWIGGTENLWVCEGFATGASIHADTGHSVACAFDTGGLMHVTKALTDFYGTTRTISIMADDDYQTVGNPGVTKAQKAANKSGIRLVIPDFSGLNRGLKDTDYNDLRRLKNG